MTLPILLHIPHSATEIPLEYQADYVIRSEDLTNQLIQLTDSYTDELYQLEGAERLVFPVSRFLVDPERFADDAHEPMSKRGMGVLYTHTTELTKLRHITPTRRTELLDRYYHPHHQALNNWAKNSLAEHGRALLIDCHSYPSRRLPYEMLPETAPRPQIGIGIDAFHTPAELAKHLADLFIQAGYEVGMNTPYAGALVPGDYYAKNPKVQAIMIELRKDLYLDEATGEKIPNFSKVYLDINEILKNFIAY